MWRASAGDLSGSHINIGRTATCCETMGTGALVDATETNQPAFHLAPPKGARIPSC